MAAERFHGTAIERDPEAYPDALADAYPDAGVEYSRPRLFGVLAWLALLLGPALAWLVVFGLTPDDKCGTWSLHCTGRAILFTAASWLFGSLLAIVALFRNERHSIAVPALVLNLIPLLGLVAACIVIMQRSG